MKRIALAALMLTPNLAAADAYILGAGRWTCANVAELMETGTPAQKYQFFGWILGYWSAITLDKPSDFIDIVENAGGEKIVKLTIQACQDSDPDVLVYQVTENLVRNTG